MAGLVAGILFAAALFGILRWAKPWKKDPTAEPTRPGVPVQAPTKK